MKTRNRSYQNRTARTARFAWVAAATLIAALILGSVAGVPIAAANSDGVARGIDAGAARYQAQGAYYSALADADTARWVALGAFYAQSSADMPYTDVSRFYVERMRAQARMQAQAGQGGDLVLNPELRLARAGYRAGVGLLACSRSDADLSANPELSSFGRNRHC